MKLKLPYSEKEFQKLNIIKKVEVQRFNRISPDNHEEKLRQAEYVRGLVDKIYEYINIRDYNKYSKNMCKFYNSDDTEDICEGRFNNSLANYSSNGNCCKSCNAVLINLSKKYELQD